MPQPPIDPPSEPPDWAYCSPEELEARGMRPPKPEVDPFDAALACVGELSQAIEDIPSEQLGAGTFDSLLQICDCLERVFKGCRILARKEKRRG